MPLLDIKHLTIEIDTPHGRVKAVDRVSLTLAEGEIRGLVGESGSGKSLVAKAIVGVTKDSWHITADRLQLGDVDLLTLSPRKRREVIGREIAMVFQEPIESLDPSDRVGAQLIESIPAERFKGKFYQRLYWRRRTAKKLLHQAGIKNHREVMRSFPYELTSGEAQKVMIAMALAREPRLLIADEPTAEVDSMTQAQIFRIMGRMNQVNNTAIILISHDLTTITQWADRITVMYCGQSIESGNREQLVERTRHPYTDALLRAMPDFSREDNIAHKSRLPTLPGSIPSLQHLPIGCRLGPRCPYAQRKCIEVPPRQFEEKDHKFSCHFPLYQEKQQ